MRKKRFQISKIKKTSYLLAFASYIILLIIISFVEISKNIHITDDVILIDFNKNIFHNINHSKKKNNPLIKDKQKILTPKKTANNILTEFVLTNDSTKLLFHNLDSIVVIDSSVNTDTLTILDSLVLKYPSLLSLRAAMSEDIKNNKVKKTENEIFNARVNEAMQDYYKMKYPTPLHKFGEKGSGVGIRIPIDDIIDLFK